MQARQLRRARGSHRSFDRPRPYLPSTGPAYVRPFLLRVSSTGPAYVWCGAYVFPRQGSALLTSYAWYPALHRQAPPMSGARGAWPYLLCVVLCFAYLDRPRLCAVTGLCVVTCLTSTAPGFASTPPALLCFAWPGLALPLLRHPPALLTFDSPWLCFDTPRGCFACFACFAYVLTCFLHILRAVTLVVYMRKR